MLMKRLFLCLCLIALPLVAANLPPIDKKALLEAIDQMMADLPAESAYHTWLIESGPVYGNYCGPEHGDLTFNAPCLSRMDCICKAHDFGSSVKNFLESASGKIDENGELRKKLEQIKGERLKFEERALEIHEVDEWSPKTLAISLQPLSLIQGLFSLALERRLSRVLSLRIGTSFLGSGLITDTYLGYSNNKDFSAFGALGLKTFVTGETLSSGIFIEPAIDFGYENVINQLGTTRENVRDFAFVPAVLVGAEKTFLSGIQVEAGIGLGYHLGIPLSTFPEGYSAHFVVPKFRASLGYAW